MPDWVVRDGLSQAVMRRGPPREKLGVGRAIEVARGEKPQVQRRKEAGFCSLWWSQSWVFWVHDNSNSRDLPQSPCLSPALEHSLPLISPSLTPPTPHFFCPGGLSCSVSLPNSLSLFLSRCKCLSPLLPTSSSSPLSLPFSSFLAFFDSMDSLIHSFNHYLLSTYLVPGPVLGTRDTGVRKTEISVPCGTHVLVWRGLE